MPLLNIKMPSGFVEVCRILFQAARMEIIPEEYSPTSIVIKKIKETLNINKFIDGEGHLPTE